MKRFFLFFGLIITSLTLTACDFIPEDIIDQIDQATEEICLEDPDNPVCDIESLDDIEESVVRGLVTDAVALLNDPDNNACDTVFSVTNPDLIDRCKAGELVSEDITGFTIDSYEQDGDTYIFKGTNEMGDPLEISVTVGSLEELMKLTSFTAKTPDVCADDCDDGDTEVKPFETVDQDEALAYIEAFFQDFVDPTMSNPMFSENYLEGDMVESLIDERNDIINNNVEATLRNVYFNDLNEFVIEYEYRQGDDLILRKRPGRIRKRPDLLTSEWDELIDSSIELRQDVADELFNQFINDYLNPEISDEILTRQYFESEDQSFIPETRQQDLREGIDMTVSSLTPYRVFGQFNFILTITQDEETTQQLVSIQIMNYDNSSPYIFPVAYTGIDDDCDGDGLCDIDDDKDDLINDIDTGTDIIHTLLEKYNEPSTSLEDLQESYDGNLPLFAFREFDLANELEWTVAENIRLLEDGTFIFTLQALHNETIIHRDIATRIYSNGNNPLFEAEQTEGVNPLYEE
jgi:hypothetical protein